MVAVGVVSVIVIVVVVVVIVVVVVVAVAAVVLIVVVAVVVVAVVVLSFTAASADEKAAARYHTNPKNSNQYLSSPLLPSLIPCPVHPSKKKHRKTNTPVAVSPCPS